MRSVDVLLLSLTGVALALAGAFVYRSHQQNRIALEETVTEPTEVLITPGELSKLSAPIAYGEIPSNAVAIYAPGIECIGTILYWHSPQGTVAMTRHGQVIHCLYPVPVLRRS
jgi:hypothetical protein